MSRKVNFPACFTFYHCLQNESWAHWGREAPPADGAAFSFCTGEMVESLERTTTFSKFADLTAEAQAARLLHRRELGFTSVRLVAAEVGLPVERAKLLMCRGLSTLLARGYPAEELCETYRVTLEQLSRVAAMPAFSSTFAPLASTAPII